MTDSQYSPDSLYAGIDQCKKNIQVFEEAIQKERDTINEYYGMINVIDSKRRLAEKRELAAKDNTMTILENN